MKSAVVFACLTLLLVVEHVQGQYYYASCKEELEAAQKYIANALDQCRSAHCISMCACVYMKIATDGGDMDINTIMKGIQAYFSSSLVGQIEAVAKKCLSPFGGSLHGGDSCDKWNAFGDCTLQAVPGLCSGRRMWGWDGPWGSWGRK